MVHPHVPLPALSWGQPEDPALVVEHSRQPVPKPRVLGDVSRGRPWYTPISIRSLMVPITVETRDAWSSLVTWIRSRMGPRGWCYSSSVPKGSNP